MKITLAKALKLKNRLASKVGTVSEKIRSYNSLVEGQERPVDVNELMTRREKLVDALISLKTGISAANTSIQSTIYLMEELKSDLTFLRSIDTTSGKQVTHSWREEATTLTKTAVLDYATVQSLIEQAEADVDANQDKLDKHNHTLEIEIGDEVMGLLRG